jgi:hypothetical protein
MATPPEPPTREALVADLKLLREKGLVSLPPLTLTLTLTALRQAARILSSDPKLDEAALIETVVRRAVSQLGGGKHGVATAELLGLTPDTKTLTAGLRRVRAAEALGVSLSTLLRKHERPILEQVAAQILTLCTEQRLITVREQLQPRPPFESGLALHWIEMFQAYYRLWTPIYALAADLTAYRMTLLEEPRPYDRPFGTTSEGDIGYSQEEQAEHYATFALYHYTRFEWELRRFINRYGGMWMLSNPQTEQDAPDAIARIDWHVNPFNERDQSFLRTTLDETPSQEMHGFLDRLMNSVIGRKTHQEWQEWAGACQCTWNVGADIGDSYFPTTTKQNGISVDCQVHQVIDACGCYCWLIDEDWHRTADWYQIPKQINHDRTAEQRYAQWRATPMGAAYRSPE